MYMTFDGRQWQVQLSSHELDLIIKGLDDNTVPTEQENEQIDRLLRVLFGIRKRYLSFITGIKTSA